MNAVRKRVIHHAWGILFRDEMLVSHQRVLTVSSRERWLKFCRSYDWNENGIKCYPHILAPHLFTFYFPPRGQLVKHE